MTCVPSAPCRGQACPYCDPGGYVDAETWVEAAPPEPLWEDLSGLLAGGIPPPAPPVALRREDGVALLYAGRVSLLYGDPECGKTWIALAAIQESLRAGRRCAMVDLDHNGAAELATRLLALGARPEHLADQGRFRLACPEDVDGLARVVYGLREWRPAVVSVDSIGEMLPMLGLSSNSPDDYTSAHRRVLTPLAEAGAVVIAIDHLPKASDARAHGPTGTLAKRRAVNGVILRVDLRAAFAPGRGGAAGLSVVKDRPGAVRASCPPGTPQMAGVFRLAPTEGGLTWSISTPRAASTSQLDRDVAELDALDPPPSSVREARVTLGWRQNRAVEAMRVWRELRQRDEDIDG